MNTSDITKSPEGKLPKSPNTNSAEKKSASLKVTVADTDFDEIPLEDFGAFLMQKIGNKYEDGIHGLRDRFITVFNQIATISTMT